MDGPDRRIRPFTSRPCATWRACRVARRSERGDRHAPPRRCGHRRAQPARYRSVAGSPTPHPGQHAPPSWPLPTSKLSIANSPNAASGSAVSGTSHRWTVGMASGRRDQTPNAVTTPACPTPPTPTATPGCSRKSASDTRKTPPMLSPSPDLRRLLHTNPGGPAPTVPGTAGPDPLPSRRSSRPVPNPSRTPRRRLPRPGRPDLDG